MMMQSRCIPPLLLAAVIGACGDTAWPTEMDVPAGLASMPVTIGFRQSLSGERLPAVTLTADDTVIRVRVAKTAICATSGTAGYQLRGPSSNEILVVASVFPNPGALCVDLTSGVTEYEGVIRGLAPRTYNIFVYETGGTGKAQFIGGGAFQVRGIRID